MLLVPPAARGMLSPIWNRVFGITLLCTLYAALERKHRIHRSVILAITAIMADYSISTASSATILKSQCHCRGVVLDIRLPSSPDHVNLSRVLNCHCRSCRRYHTSAYVSYLVLPERSDQPVVSIRQGQDKMRKIPSQCSEFSESVERWYCRDCSSKLVSVAKQSKAAKGGTFQTYLINLGPMDESTILDDVCQQWKQQLIHISSNRQLDQSSSWHRALPAKRRRPQAAPPASCWTGGCSCGACQYRITVPEPTELQHCYCHMSRELSGGPSMTWMPVEEFHMEWYNKQNLQLVRTTPFGQRHICRTCRSVMTIVYDDQPGYIWPCAGGLDDATLPTSTAEMGTHLVGVCHIFCLHLPSWLDLPDDGMENRRCVLKRKR